MSTVKKSQASRPLAWARRKVRQEVSWPRERAGGAGAEDPPHSRLTEVMAEAGELTVHPAVSPARVLARQPQHQVADLLAGPGAAH